MATKNRAPKKEAAWHRAGNGPYGAKDRASYYAYGTGKTVFPSPAHTVDPAKKRSSKSATLKRGK